MKSMVLTGSRVKTTKGVPRLPGHLACRAVVLPTLAGLPRRSAFPAAIVLKTGSRVFLDHLGRFAIFAFLCGDLISVCQYRGPVRHRLSAFGPGTGPKSRCS